MLLKPLLLLSLLAFTSSANPDEVKSMPGLDFQPPFKHYSGYLEANTGHFLHYWFFESQNDPVNDPVVLWLNGGPGCSSLAGELTENGPLKMESNGTLSLNPYAWNRKANLIYLESPVGVGYSYRDDGNYTTDDDQTAEDNFLALKSFFKKYPRFEGNDFYITGESYAGVYIPTLSMLALENNYPPKFKAVAIGNGLLDDYLLANSLIHFMHNHGFIGKVDYDHLLSHCCAKVANIEKCKIADSKDGKCQELFKKVMKKTHTKYLFDRYNLYKPVDGDAQFELLEKSRDEMLDTLERTGLLGIQEPPRLTQKEAMAKYLNTDSVKEALHIKHTERIWLECNTHTIHYKSIYLNQKKFIEHILDSGKKVLIYNGDVDSVCNFLGDEWFVNGLGRKTVKHYDGWGFGKVLGGFKKVYQNITFMTIRGSGHMVPTDKPAEAYYMFDQFLTGEIFQ